MSDPHFDDGNGEGNNSVGSLTSVSRRSSVTDSLDTIFDVLSDAHRRYLLYYLFTMEGDVTEFDAAANAVYKYEVADTESDDYSASESIRVELHHTHLPMLANAGFLDFDPRQGTIQFTPTPPLEEWVEHVEWKELD